MSASICSRMKSSESDARLSSSVLSSVLTKLAPYTRDATLRLGASMPRACRAGPTRKPVAPSESKLPAVYLKAKGSGLPG